MLVLDGHGGGSSTYVAQAAAEAIADVITGRADCVHLAGVLPTEWCDGVAERFKASPFPKQRLDGVPGRELGVSAFAKCPERYFDLVYEQRGGFEQMLGGAGNPFRRLLLALQATLARQRRTLRLAHYRGETASPGRIINWQLDQRDETYLLQLHSDVEQVRAPINADFEIRSATRVAALNVYLQAHRGSGQLQVSDWRLTDEERIRLGVRDTGYPIPSAAIPPGHTLRAYDLATGDIVCMDGALVHGVIAGKGRVTDRLLLNLFMGTLPDGGVIMWS